MHNRRRPKREKQRYVFMRGLIEHEKQQRTRHYLKTAAECTSRAIVSLELSDEPVKTVKQARQLEGIGGETCAKLTKLEKERNFSNLKPIGGKFVSSAGAILVALLEASDDELMRGHSQDRPVLISESHIRRRAGSLSEEAFLDQDHLGFCKAWWRLEVLIKRGLVRRRSYKKEPVLQLLPLGRDIANGLRGDVGRIPMPLIAPTVPPILPIESVQSTSTVGQDMSPTLPWNVQGDLSLRHDDALYTNDDGTDGVVILVDIQEWGGDRVGLGDLCRLLAQANIRYKTRKLAVGDYSWFWRVDGVERTLPCLIERKRADDVARTLKEGRFWSQVNKMVAWKKEYQSRGIDCYLHYILEREPEEYVVQCEDGCQGVGRCGYPTLTQVKLAIEDLKKHPDLQVKMTDSMEVTVILLSSLTSELIERARKGDFDNLIAQEIAGENRGTVDTTNSSHNNTNKNSLLKTDASDSLEKIPITLIEDDEIRSVEKLVGRKGAENLKCKTTSDKFLKADVETYEDELALAIEKSKKDIRSRYSSGIVNASPSTSDSIYNKVRGNVDSSLLQKDSNLDRSETDVLMDRELAIAIENSKRDTKHDSSIETGYNSISDTDEATSLPLMQYHCSLSKSVTCTVKSPKKKDINSNVYRPKINRTKEYNAQSSSKSDLTSIGAASANKTNLTLVNETEKFKEPNKGSKSYSEESNLSTSKLPENTEHALWVSSHNSGSSSRSDLTERTGRKHKSPFIDLDCNSSPTNEHIHVNTREKETDKVPNTIKKKRQKIFQFNSDSRFVERNVINLQDSNVNDRNHSTKSKGTVSSSTSNSCFIKSSQGLRCDSDEDIFDNDNDDSDIIYTCSNFTSNKRQEQDCNSSGFEPDSSSDSLPDLMLISSKANTDVSAKRCNEKNMVLKPRQSERSQSKYTTVSISDSEDDSAVGMVKEKVNVKTTRRSSYQIVSDDDIEEKIYTILGVLPQLDREKCFWLLHRFLGKVDRCIEHVLHEENKLTHGDVIDLDD